MKTFKVLASLVLGVSLFLSATPINASAEEVNGKVGAGSGYLSLEIDNKNFNFDEIVYRDGSFISYAMFEPDGTIQDLRANGEGWKIYVEATPLKEVKQPGSSVATANLKTVPTGSLKVGKEVTIEDDFYNILFDTDWDKVSDLENDYVSIDDTPVLLAEVSADQATGVFHLTETFFGISIPAEFPVVNPLNLNQTTQLTEYETTITFSIVTAP